MNDVPLRDYVDVRISEVQRAVDKAEESLTRRLEGLNEFRQQMADESEKFAAQGVVNEQIGALNARLARLESDLYERRGAERRTDQQTTQQAATIGQVIAAVAVIVTIAAIVVGAFT